ncbi:ABC transporter [Xylaria intraflava]|nr:ABC transporter [Xylaria intraflava]
MDAAGCSIPNLAFGFSPGDGCATTGTSDFTVTLYQFMYWLSLITAAAFVPLSILRLLYVWHRPVVLRTKSRVPSILLIAKALSSISLAALRLGLLIIVVGHADLGLPRSITSTAFRFTVSALLIVLSPLEHLKSTRPSTVACSYLFLSFIYDLTRAPSLWSASFYIENVAGYTSFIALFTAAILVEFLFLILESWSRKRWTPQDTAAADRSPEEMSSVFSLGLYSWLIPLLRKGYHASLGMKDLYALDRALSINTIVQQQQASKPISDKSTGTSTWQLMSWVIKSLPWTVALPIFPRLLLLGFTLSQPFFLQRLLIFLSSGKADSETSSGLVAATIFIYSGIAVSTGFYWYYQERFQSSLRGFLINAIYAKSVTAAHVGDGDTAAVTLMGTDVERIYTGVRLMHEVWASIIQIAIASWLLYRQLGLAFLAPLVVVLLGFINSYFLSKNAVKYQTAWMTHVQSRVGVTSSFLSTLKDLRFSGMAGPAAALVQSEREEEIRVGEKSRTLTATSASLSLLPQAIAPALAFAFGPRVLDQTRAFTALSLLALQTTPLMMVLQSIPIIAAAFACLRRIKLFLLRDPRTDPRFFEPAGEPSEKATENFVSIEDGSFSWTADCPVLQHMNVSLPRSSITFVVGPVGVGKSTLCRALLGEVPYTQGRITLKSDKIGYCDQTPFLFNASIKDNITGFSSFNAPRYTEVLRATMLIKDINSLPAGENTIVGSKGISLSGGQRQRISLARALYIDADILIIDDVFSGLDGFTQEQVCNSVFGPNGLLRKRGTTAILCTHATRFLSAASHGIVLSPDGNVLEQGSIADIQKGKWHNTHGSTPVTADALPEVDDFSLESETTEEPSHIRNSQVEIPSVKVTQTPAEPRPGVDLDVYRYWLSTIGILLPLIYLILVVGLGFFSNFPTIWLKLWTADSTEPNSQHSFSYWIGIYVFLATGVVLCVFPAGLILLRNVVRLSGSEFHQSTVNTITRSSLHFLGTTDVGKVLNLFSQDMNIMDTQLPRMMNNMCFSLSIAVGQAVVIALSSAWLALSYPAFLALLWAVQRIYLPTSKRLRLLDLEAKTPLYTNFLDTLGGLPTIRASGWLGHYQAQSDALLDDSQRPSYLLAIAQQWLMLTMNVIVALVAVILVALATQLGSNAGSVGAGLVTLITLGTTLSSIVVAYTGLETSLGAISRLKNFRETTELEDGGKLGEVPPESWPSRGHLQFQGVKASYDGTHQVLKGINFEVRAGEKIAVCGRTGSGKSSILALLMRLIEPIASDVSGESRILIDGVPLNTVNHATLRERIISASQEPVFLPNSTSFRTNLDPWGRASENECSTVLRDLDLADIVAAKGGLDVSINGAELSAGQKQLFTLARVVLRRRVKLRETGADGGLLLLDETTSSADAQTTQRVQSLLETEFASYTAIMVTHHREIAVGCDRVIVLDSGRVVEEGKPAELQSKADSWFRKLFSP